MLPDFRLETYFSRWEFNARHHMTASDMETLSMQELLDMADDAGRQAWGELRLGYTETFGRPSLRRAIADTYERIEVDDVLTFAGAEEGIFAAMQVLLSPDDHAIVITPNYQAAETIPLSICEVTGIALNADEDWNLDIDAVEQAIRPTTKVISINFPHNPTGKVIDHATLDRLVDVARDHDIHLFSDEVYRLLERDTARRMPQIADIYEKGLSLNVMSKAYGLPGLRIGWIATRDRSVLSAMERAKHYLSICNSGPSEVLAEIALGARDAILRRNHEIISANLELLNEFFEEYVALFDWSLPDGGCIGYPRYLGDDGVEAFCKSLVEEAGVLLLPASVYSSQLTDAPTDRFRIGFGRKNIGEGLDAMRAHLDDGRRMRAAS
jgi:aspartate/methionine/tyrosine aminotransferase